MSGKQSGSFLLLKEETGRNELPMEGMKKKFFLDGKGLGSFHGDKELTGKFQTMPGSFQEDLTFTGKAQEEKFLTGN